MHAHILEGSITDYRALARFHYRPAAPATVCRVLVARSQASRPIGVLVVSRPSLNGPWRDLAWPGRFAPRSLARLNAEVRVISRIVVEPRFRGLGIAGSLLRTYLRDPLTPRTEALAAMGAFSTLFESAGMRPIVYPPARRVLMLRRRLTALGIRPWMLADPDGQLANLHHDALIRLEHALRVFANAHRDTRAVATADLRTLIIAAARRIASRPLAFVTEHDPP